MSSLHGRKRGSKRRPLSKKRCLLVLCYISEDAGHTPLGMHQGIEGYVGAVYI